MRERDFSLVEGCDADEGAQAFVRRSGRPERVGKSSPLTLTSRWWSLVRRWIRWQISSDACFFADIVASGWSGMKSIDVKGGSCVGQSRLFGIWTGELAKIFSVTRMTRV